MTLMKKTTSVLVLLLSLSLLVVGVAVNASADEKAMEMEVVKSERIIKPFKAGTEMYCLYDEYTTLWSCRH